MFSRGPDPRDEGKGRAHEEGASSGDRPGYQAASLLIVAGPCPAILPGPRGDHRVDECVTRGFGFLHCQQQPVYAPIRKRSVVARIQVRIQGRIQGLGRICLVAHGGLPLPKEASMHWRNQRRMRRI